MKRTVFSMLLATLAAAVVWDRAVATAADRDTRQGSVATKATDPGTKPPTLPRPRPPTPGLILPKPPDPTPKPPKPTPKPPVPTPKPPAPTPTPTPTPTPVTRPPYYPPRPIGGIPVVVFPDNWLPYYGVNPYYSYYGYGYGTDYYPYVYSYPYYYGGPFWVPPVVLPAETLYGPQATMRFMGVDKLSRPASNTYVPRTGSTTPAVEKPSKPASTRGTSAKSLASAQDYMRFGDTKFAGAKYAEASQRYRKAAQIAPQMADPWFRQGFAQAAMGDKDAKHYELAAVAIRRGLELKPEWPKSNFRISELYGGDDQAKTDHIEALAKAAEAQPSNGDLMFLVGVHLYFDGRPDRAAPFFKRAAELSGGDKSHLKPFLGNEE